ncbi:MAG: transcription antitermination factor NusB [Polyangiales bacterium]
MARNRRPDHGEVRDTTPVTARLLAATVIERVVEGGAFASRALDAELSRASLDPRDGALATEIVYGTLRVLPDLDRIIAARLTRGSARLDSFVHATLRTAAYQLAHLGRLPTHAIVDESVSQTRRKRGPKLAGFVNAVLRRLAEARPAEPSPATAVVLPSWVHDNLARALDGERLARFLDQGANPATLCLRADSAPREQLLAQLTAALPGADIGPAALSPLGVQVRRVGSPRALPGYTAGAFSVQEEGAQLIALALGARPGERIADVCAGHGGKTTLIARHVGPTGRVLALDKDERKLSAIPGELARIGLADVPIELHPVDLSVGVGGLAGDLDRVLVDAPCTGLGTAHRRPELLLRLSPEDPARLGKLQLAILTRAAGLVRVGGTLAYAVCSPTHEEGRDVADAFGAAHPGFQRVSDRLIEALPAPDPDGVLRIGPWLAESAGPDAYQLVVWRRTN